MSSEPIRVFLVDDQMLVRTGFRMLIDAQDDMVVLGEAPDGAQAVAALAPGRPGADTDVVLMDIRMPVMDGVEATRRIVDAAAATDQFRSGGARSGKGTGARSDRTTLTAGAQHCVPGQDEPADRSVPAGPKVLVLTTFDIDEYVFAALRAGASGFLLKDARPDELLGAIRSVAAGDAVVAPSATRRLIATVVHALPGGQQSTERLAALTARELEVLREIAGGASNSEIAENLFMAEATVKTHIGHLLAKMQIRDRVGLVVLAYETGLVSA